MANDCEHETVRLLSAMERTLSLLERGERMRRIELWLISTVCLAGFIAVVGLFVAGRAFVGERDALVLAVETNGRLLAQHIAAFDRSACAEPVAPDPPAPVPPHAPPPAPVLPALDTSVPIREPGGRDGGAVPAVVVPAASSADGGQR